MNFTDWRIIPDRNLTSLFEDSGYVRLLYIFQSFCDIFLKSQGSGLKCEKLLADSNPRHHGSLGMKSLCMFSV